MTTQADETRRRLIEAATREFAERGIHTASLLEITRLAGQRNRGAVHYHFGSREGMVAAVIAQDLDRIAERERELIATARERPEDLLAAAEAVVRPAFEVAESGWTGQCCVMIIAQLVNDAPDTLHPEIAAVFERAGSYEAVQLLEQRLPPMPDDLRGERLSLAMSFYLRAIADRARADLRDTPGRPQLDAEEFVANLVAMTTGMLTAPVPTAG